jgi:hypothetical protein
MEDESFSLEKVLRLKKSKETKKCDIIDYHYPRVIHKIQESYKEYQDFCYYIVDPIIISLPHYDADIVALELAERLQEEGYNCKLLYQNKIYINWKPKERPNDHIPLLLKNIQAKIELYANNGSEDCLLEIPVVMVEFPWYNANDATITIGQKLYELGFIVKLKANWLYISWSIEALGKFKKTKFEFETTDEARRKAMEKINFINESRYIDFINPKKSKVPNGSNNGDITYNIDNTDNTDNIGEFTIDMSEPKKKNKVKHDSDYYQTFMRR